MSDTKRGTNANGGTQGNLNMGHTQKESDGYIAHVKNRSLILDAQKNDTTQGQSRTTVDNRNAKK